MKVPGMPPSTRSFRLQSPRLTVDDSYAAWFNAHSRCTHALRAWNAAAPKARAAAYRAYQAELAIEEEAARTLELLNLRAAG
jgi:hypothetical protein